MRISGSVAIVTGGARGCGKAFTEALLKRGAKVCFADVDVLVGRDTEREFQTTYGPDSSFFIECVFTATKARYQNIHLVVNNAGSVSEQNWEMTIATNLIATMRGTYLAMEYMRRDMGGDGGLVVNMASMSALTPMFFCPAYTASKHGILGFTRSWAMNPVVETFGIHFATLCPGPTDTRFYRESKDKLESTFFTYSNVENREIVDAAFNTAEPQGIDDVAGAFIDLVEKEDNNGAVVSVTKEEGVIYKFEDNPQKL